MLSKQSETYNKILLVSMTTLFAVENYCMLRELMVASYVMCEVKDTVVLYV